MKPTSKDLEVIDFNHLWHPFTQHQVWYEFGPPLVVERADGMYLVDIDGRRYLDGVSSLWCNVHGHGAPYLIDALKDQISKLCHSTLLGLSHEPILTLTEKLLEFVPPTLTRAFYSDSGAAAVEAALRMALEWWQNQPQSSAHKRTKFISLIGSYHGDTLGAVGVGYMPEFHAHLQPILVTARRFRPPHIFRYVEGLSEADALTASIQELQQLLKVEGNEIAALVMEPIVQGAAGIWVQPSKFLSAVAEECRRHDVIFIADEVATGFGKTGKMFAIEFGIEQGALNGKDNLAPDILVLGKGLSGGYLPISACVTAERIFEAFLGEPQERKTFSYGQTFAGNPLAARVSRANLELFQSSRLLEALPSKIEYFNQEVREKIQPLNHVEEVRMQGLMVGIELTSQPGKRAPYSINEKMGWKIVQEARRRGLFVRPLGNVVILMPALAMEEKELTFLVDTIRDSIIAVTGE